MIPRAELFAVAEDTGLLPTTVEKDYVLGWVLFGIAQHPVLARWLFKGGTCLKKCYFDTYRFSEDLDFTIPSGVPYDADPIRNELLEVGAWVQEETGIELPPDGLEVEESVNKRGAQTFMVRVTFLGPMQLARAQRQRLRFDLSNDEIVVDQPELREVFHGYSDAPAIVPHMRCYTLHEIVAEKVRALVERVGRARDVYDVVNVGRNLRAEVSQERVQEIVAAKFTFKALGVPNVDAILAGIDQQVFAADWSNALRHQLVVLPPAEEFAAALREVLEWLLEPAKPMLPLPSVPARAGEILVSPVRFGRPAAAGALGRGAPVRAAAAPGEIYGSRMDRVRFAARNRLLARVAYNGVPRLVEPYSLRMPKTGNLLLYVFEVARGSGPGEGIKALKVAELGDVAVTDEPFRERYLVEL